MKQIQAFGPQDLRVVEVEPSVLAEGEHVYVPFFCCTCFEQNVRIN